MPTHRMDMPERLSTESIIKELDMANELRETATPSILDKNRLRKQKFRKPKWTINSSTLRDPTQCSAYIFTDHLILLNFRLNELSVEFKNVRIGVWTRKFWPSEVVAADSQGCAEIWAHHQSQTVMKPRETGL